MKADEPKGVTSFFAKRPRVEKIFYLICWLACLAAASGRFYHARTEFDNRSSDSPELHRADGNYGHTTIDFGGQWLMGRMLVTGNGKQLYHRQAQWPIAWAAFPTQDESPFTRELGFPEWRKPEYLKHRLAMHDAEALMYCFMGSDPPEITLAMNQLALGVTAPEGWSALLLTNFVASQLDDSTLAAINRPALGGPLYPPIHAMTFAPLALTNDPRSAYAWVQWLGLVATFGAGFLIARITNGAVIAPLATFMVLAFPGYRSGLDLGQNQLATLFLLLLGWRQLQCGRPILAGIIWGLLAFKPVWAATFLMVPLLLGQFRMVLAMILTAGLWILASLPFVGVQSWFDWLTVGQEASQYYQVNSNWIRLSRDLSGLVRRVLVDFDLPEAQRDTPDIRRISLLPNLLLALSTLIVYARTRLSECKYTLRAGFLALSAYLSCYHFMYYDAVIALFPITLLLADHRALWGSVWTASEPTPDEGLPIRRVSLPGSTILLVILLLSLENHMAQLALGFIVEFGFLGGPPTELGGMPTEAPRLRFETTIYYACDTFLLLALWFITAFRLLTSRRRTA